MATAKEAEQAVLEAYNAQMKAAGYDSEMTDSFERALRNGELLYSFDSESVGSTAYGKVDVVADVGGSEGDGETRYAVFSLTSPEGEVQFFRVDGYYASWDGSNWDDASLYEVEAVPVQNIEYRRKK